MSASSAAEAQRRLSLVVDSIADGFYALDPDWRFSHVDRHIARPPSPEMLESVLAGA